MKNKIKNFLENNKVEYFIFYLILLNLFVFILSTDININSKFSSIFDCIEVFSVFIFTMEYFLRIFSAKKLTEIFKPLMIIDLCAILPFYLSFLVINTTFLRVFRLLRIFRFAKIIRYIDAINLIKSAFIKRKYELIITGIVFCFGILIFSIAIYFAENQTGNVIFKSVPSSFWWAIVTITTVGYGDSVPVTVCGRLIASITAIFGVGLHGLLIGVISSAIYDVINLKKNTENM